jgi:hypothetical protein
MTTLLSLLLVPALQAADTSLGFAVDAAAGAWSTDGDAQTFAGMREVEGDLGVRSGAFRARVNLELGLSFVEQGAQVVLARPEHVTAGLVSGKQTLEVGVAPGPWRIESVDRWENALVTTFTGTQATPAQVLGGSFRFGKPATNVSFLGGWGYADNGLDFSEGAQRDGAPVAGVHAQVGLGGKSNATRIAGGAWTHPGDPKKGGFELGTRVDAGVAAVQAEVVGGFDGSVRAQVGAEALSRMLLTPVGRLSWADGTPGVALGVRMKPLPLLALKAQGAWEQKQVSGWVEAAFYKVPEPLK